MKGLVMENSSKMKTLETIIVIFKHILSVAKIIVSAALLHGVIYILYLATAGYSIKSGALFNPTAENFAQFNASVLMVFVPTYLFCVMFATFMMQSFSKAVKVVFDTIIVAVLALFYGPYYDAIPAPNLFLFSIVLWISLPFVINSLYEFAQDVLIDDVEDNEDYAVKRLQKLESSAYEDSKTGAIIYRTTLPGFASEQSVDVNESTDSSESTSESTSTSESESVSEQSSEVAIWNTPLVAEKEDATEVASSEISDEQNVNSLEHPINKDTIVHLENVLSAKFGGATYVEPDKVDDMLDSAIREQNHEEVLESIAKYKETSHRRYGGHKG